MIEGNDGGANVTFDGGRTWSTQDNQPTAEIYRVTVDDRSSRTGSTAASRTTPRSRSRAATPAAASRAQDWYAPAGCEIGHVAVDPREPRRHLRRLLRRLDHPLRPLARPLPGDHGLARAGGRPAGAATCATASSGTPRSGSRPTTRRCSTTARTFVHRSTDEGADLGGDQPRPDPQRRVEAGLRRRSDHPRQHRRRGLRHDLRVRGVAARAGAAVGRHRRRPGPPVAGRRRDLAEHHPESDARVGPR